VGKECVLPAAEATVVIDREAMEAVLSKLVDGLVGVPFFHPGNDSRAFHGRATCLDPSSSSFPEPKVVWASDKKPRQNSPDWLTATEYADAPYVLLAKVKLFKQLLLASRRTMAYSGAGLSVAAGIGMAAVGSSGGAGTGMGVAEAGEPTTSHCVMAELNRQNLLHGWVQQNHDGLPQKAGYKQEDINEIHGSWFDPSNPVVKYSGRLRGDLCADMQMQAETSDLVVVLGTSLTGLNADQCVDMTADRSTQRAALGSVIISPQRTGSDGEASLRIFAKADEVMTLLAKEFGFGPRAFGQGLGIKRSADLFTKRTKVLVPYDRNGDLSTSVKTYWDLSPGAKIRMSQHNNLKGAKQPRDSGLTADTVGTVSGRDDRCCSITVTFKGIQKRLGLWWLETALRGGVEHLPFVNVDAEEMPAAIEGAC
jgi:NAD-dependent SIR2 family protein deacetylase